MDAQARLDYLNEIVETPNDTAWTIKQLALQVSPQFSGKIEVSLSAMSQMGKPFSMSTLMALSTAGGLPLVGVDALIDQLAADSQSLPVEQLRWDSDFVATIKSLGVIKQPRWQAEPIHGYTVQPTIASCTRDVLRDALQSKTTAIVAWLEALDTSAMTVEQVQEYFDTLLASEDGNP